MFLMDDMISFLRDNMGSLPGDKAVVTGKGRGFEIDENNFHTLASWVSSKPIAFIDGGSSMFIQSPSLCVGFVRAVCVVMSNKKTEQVLSDEFFCVASAFSENGKIFYRTKYFPTKNTKNIISELKFDSLDPSLSTGQERFPLCKMIDVARRFLEIRLAVDSVEKIKSKGIIILDGNLKAYYPGEKELLDTLYDSAGKGNVLVTGIAKTSNSITVRGDTLTAALFNSTDLEQWYYYPAYELEDENHKAETFFVKFHKLSKYVFAVDVLKEQAKDADIGKVLGFFAYYSKDAVFPGYPYGLIKADSLARVSNRETEILLTRFSSLDPSLFELIRSYIYSVDAHSVLDNLS